MRIFLQEEQTKDEAAQVFEDYSKIRGYDMNLCQAKDLALSTQLQRV